jgi:hypothetical protein
MNLERESLLKFEIGGNMSSFFKHKSGILCTKLLRLIPRALWNLNEQQTRHKSFSIVVCPSQLMIEQKTLIKLEETYTITSKRSWVQHIYAFWLDDDMNVVRINYSNSSLNI